METALSESLCIVTVPPKTEPDDRTQTGSVKDIYGIRQFPEKLIPLITSVRFCPF
mgnify:CR=1 FL=1